TGKVAEVVILGQLADFVLIVEVGDEDVFRVGKNIGVNGGNFLGRIHGGDAGLGAFLGDARPDFGQRLVAADDVVGLLDVDDNVGRIGAAVERRHRALKDVPGDAFA